MALTVNELSYIDQFLYARLDGDAIMRGLLGGHERVWADVIPEGQPFPGVILSYQSGVDVVALGTVERIITRPLYLVKAVATGDSYVPASAIADRIEALLGTYSGTQGPITIGKMYREQPLRYHKVDEGVRYNHVGGLYRLFIS